MLNIVISSFSYIYGAFPKDKSGNGGGFIFDCRALPNPGRFEEFKSLSGKDSAVCQFLEKDPEVGLFFDSVKKLVTQSVEKYRERGYTSLMVSFGCTGGQHRSVYLAEKLTEYLRDNFDINIILDHLNEKNWKENG